MQETHPETHGGPRALEFHTCSSSVDVYLNSDMELLLLELNEMLSDPSVVTPFDVFIHGQILHSNVTFNIL